MHARIVKKKRLYLQVSFIRLHPVHSVTEFVTFKTLTMRNVRARAGVCVCESGCVKISFLFRLQILE